MGMNFYLITKDKEIAEKFAPYSFELTDAPYWGYKIHIAKTSAGWLPLFQYHSNGISSVKDIKDIYDTGKVEIYDESEQKYLWNEFEERVLNFNGCVSGAVPAVKYDKSFKGKEYKYKQQGDISCKADTDHIRCVIEEFKEDLMKKEENNMKNYIVINGKKAELTKEQLKQLGIEVEKKRNNFFNGELEDQEEYFVITAEGVKTSFYDHITDKKRINNANSFNDKAFANQVYLHELLNRKLLKYAYDNNAEDYEWDRNGVNPHYYIYFDSTKGHFVVEANHYCRSQNIYFSSMNIAEQAIKDIVEPFMEIHSEFVW